LDFLRKQLNLLRRPWLPAAQGPTDYIAQGAALSTNDSGTEVDWYLQTHCEVAHIGFVFDKDS
jgi:hypothetical protein